MAENVAEALAKVKASFRKADTSGSGVIEKDPLMKILSVLMPEITRNEAAKLLQAACKSSHSSFNYEEFLDYIFSVHEAVCSSPSLPKSSKEHGVFLDRTWEHIAFVSDVEGHWPFFCNFVEASKGLHFVKPGDHHQDNNFADSEIALTDGWHFVYGGDTCDKGPGTLRFLNAIIQLKKAYPSRVHFILGNRDLNKMRWTSEIAQSELDRFADVPRAFWLPNKGKTYAEFLRALAVGQGSDAESDATKFNTKANKLRYMQDLDMGAAGEFEFRRQELKHMNCPHEDSDVVQSYEDSVLKPEGLMRQYLELAHLGVLLGNTLFVHAQIIGDSHPGYVAGAADSTGTACAVGWVPGQTPPMPGGHYSYDDLPSVRSWLADLNAWAHKEIEDWTKQPFWVKPPTEETFEAWQGRAASELIAYGTPGSRVPTVVYTRYLTKACMPLEYPAALVEYLKRNSVQHVVVGHTPHGNSPTVIQHEEVSVIMADTSYSDMKSNKYFQNDNRGTAVSTVSLNAADGSCHIQGITQEGQKIDYEIGGAGPDQFLGKSIHNAAEDKLFFVKAKILPTQWPNINAQYLITNISGFSYEYQLLEVEELTAAIETGSWRGIVSKRAVGPQQYETREQRLAKVFETLSPDGDGLICVAGMLEICTDPVVKSELADIFPNADVLSPLAAAWELMHSSLSSEPSSLKRRPPRRQSVKQFASLCDSSTVSVSGLYFPIVHDNGVTVGEFPSALSPFKLMPTKAVQARHVKFEMRQAQVEQWKNRPREAELDVDVFRDEALSVVGILPTTVVSIKGVVSCARAVNESSTARSNLCIPKEAKYFVWCYPFLKSFGWAGAIAEDEVLKSSPDAQFLITGGFIYLDKDYIPFQINAAVPCKEGGIRFGQPEELAPQWLETQVNAGRFHPVTLPFLLKQGARDFCWLEPAEDVEAVEGISSCEFGGFAYVVSEEAIRMRQRSSASDISDM